MAIFVWSIVALSVQLFLKALRTIGPIHRLVLKILKLFYGTPPSHAFMSSPQLIVSRGYCVEEHKVHTADGYILTVFRISLKNPENLKIQNQEISNKFPVILQHGYLNSSDDWLLNQNGLPFVLAARGHDVWLGNSRGNNYSRQHLTLTTKDIKFWNFGIDELGIYDLPAVINYITNVTKSSKINYVGHSLGTTSLFVALSEYPALNDKVHSMVALSPAFYVKNSKSPVLQWPIYIPPKIVHGYFKWVTGGYMIPYKLNLFLKRHIPYFVSGYIGRSLMTRIVSFIDGWNRFQMAPETISLVVGHTPSNTSGKLMAHVCQAVKTGQPRKFDYGPDGNVKKYGNSDAPVYHLSNIHFPVQAWYSVKDLFVDAEDARKTISELPNLEEAIQVDDPDWTHFDFTYGKNANLVIYDQVAHFLEKS